MDDLARFSALDRRLLDRLSTRIEPFEHGFAFLDEEYRDRYDSNFLLADQRLEVVTAEALHEAAERILGGSGYRHREIVVRDDRVGEQLGPGLAERGYAAQRNVTMVHRRDPDRRSELVAEEGSFTDVTSLLHEVYRREPWTTSKDMVRAFTQQHAKYERVIGARFFFTRLDGALAGICELYVNGRDAQVENVSTLEEFRGRGVARATVTRAVEAAREAGAEHVFIVADEADWPKDLYVRLGFDRIGRTWQFIRWPEGIGPPQSAGAPG
jgi:ribosomal protein S18 acetylase RimI-like enzyme